MAGLIPKFAAMRQKAAEVVPKAYFDYVDGGADDEITLEENRKAWQRIKVLPRVMRSIKEVDTSCTIFGERWEMPLMIAPMAMHGGMHSEGECATAAAAEKCGIPMCVSMLASKDLEDIRQADINTNVFQQIYRLQDDALMESMLKGVYAKGCRCGVLTVDDPILGNREKDVANGFTFHGAPLALLKWRRGEVDDGTELVTNGELAIDGMVSFNWSAIAFIKSIVPIKVLTKGIMSAKDAVLAMEHGADGIIISNHGGRQTDTIVTSLDVLPQIAAVVKKRVPIFVDGGVQRGLDIVKALAMGASAVLIGRPILYALASGGEAQVLRVLEDLKEEFYKSLFLCGFSSVDQITADIIFKE